MNSGLTSGLTASAIRTAPIRRGVNGGVLLIVNGTGSIVAETMAGGAQGDSNAYQATNGYRRLRGRNSVDLQTARGNGVTALPGATGLVAVVGGGSSNTASGSGATVPGGVQNAASGVYTTACGASNTASNTGSVALGQGNTASGQASFVAGLTNTASAAYSSALGNRTVANRLGQFSVAHGMFAANGDAQRSFLVVRATTTDATQTELTLDGAAVTGSTITTANRIILDASSTWMVDVCVVARSASGTDNGVYHRRCCIKRDASNNTVLVGAVQTVGTDIESNAAWDVTLDADDTNESLRVLVTGAAATTIRWVAEVSLVQVTHT